MKTKMMKGLLATTLFALPCAANAAYTINLLEGGNSVIATGSGSIDLTGLTYATWGYYKSPEVWAINGRLTVGPEGEYDVYSGLNGPMSFGPGTKNGSTLDGTGTFFIPSTGDTIGIMGTVSEAENAATDTMVDRGLLTVHAGYVSGTPLKDARSVYNGSFTTLGLTPGSYVYNWGSGANADNVTVNIGPVSTAAVPEPSTWAMMLVGFGFVAGTVRYRRGSIAIRYV